MSQLSTPELSLRHYGASHGSHAHDHFQILLGLEGVLELEVEGRGRRVAAGQGCVISPGDHHDFESRFGSQCLVLDTTQAGWAHCTANPSRPGQALALGRYLAQALQQPGSMAGRHGAGLLLEAWQPRSPASGLVVYAAAARPQRAIDWPQLSAWAQQRLHEPLSVAQLARQVFLSSTQFGVRCRRETGLSVMQWLRRQRLDLAVQLRSRGLSVADTALHCGYQSPSALTAALRRQASLRGAVQ